MDSVKELPTDSKVTGRSSQPNEKPAPTSHPNSVIKVDKKDPSTDMPSLVDTPKKESISNNVKVVTPSRPSAASTADTTGGFSFAPGFNPDPQAGVVLPSPAKRPTAIAGGTVTNKGPPSRPLIKRSKTIAQKKPPIESLDLSSPHLVYQTFLQFKGNTEPIPDTIIKTLGAIFEIYTKNELAEFYKLKTQVDLPKGQKGVGVQKLAEHYFRDIQCLAQAKGKPMDVTWPPTKLMSDFTAVGNRGDPTSVLPTKVSDATVTDDDQKPAAAVQASSLL